VRRFAEAQAYLDTRSGGVVYLTRGWNEDHDLADGELDEGLASGRLVPVTPVPADVERGWMRAWADALEDGWAKDALSGALASEASLDAFEQALARFPCERRAWLACREGRVTAVLRAWLEANDLEPEEPLESGAL
jgi:hypothetical protein